MQLAQIDFYQAAQEQNLPGTEGVNAPGEGFAGLVESLLSMVMVIAGLFVLLYLIWGAFDWITAGGDSGKIQKARQKILQSVIGIIVLSSTIAIYTMLQTFLGFKALDFRQSTRSVLQNMTGRNRSSNPANMGSDRLESGNSGGSNNLENLRR